MNPWRTFRDDFTIYEQSVAFNALYYVFLFAALYGVATGRVMLLIMSGLLVIASGYVIHFRLCCPECRKSPLARDFSEFGVLGKIVNNARIWPEKTCSRCGNNLDMFDS